MKTSIIHIALLLLPLIAMISCDNSADQVLLSNQMSAKGGFYSQNSSTPEESRDTSIKKIFVYGVFPMDRSDTILSDTISASSVYFPLSTHTDSTEFIIEITKRKEHIKFYTSKKLNYVSEKSGFSFNFHIDSIHYTEQHFIDHIELVDPDVIYNKNSVHVKIYF